MCTDAPSWPASAKAWRMKSAEQVKVVWKHIRPETRPRVAAVAENSRFSCKAQLPVFRADPLGGLKREDAPDAACPHDFGLGRQAAGQRIRPFGAVVEAGGAAAQHLGHTRSVAAQIIS